MKATEVKKNSLGYKLAFMPLMFRSADPMGGVPESSCGYYGSIILNSIIIALLMPAAFLSSVWVQIITGFLFGISQLDLNLIIDYHLSQGNTLMYFLVALYIIIPAAITMLIFAGIVITCVVMGVVYGTIWIVNEYNDRSDTPIIPQEVSDYFKGICKPLKIVD